MTDKEQKKRETDRRANRTVLWRSIFLMAVFGVIVFIPLLWKLWNIQIVNHEYYQGLAIKQQTGELTVSANRGTIYDAKGNILAISATAQNVVLSPRDVLELQKKYAEAVKDGQNPDYPEPTNEFIASGLAAILNVEESFVLERLSWTDKQYALVKSKVEEDVAAQVLAFITENKLSGGIYMQPDSKRYYPYSSLASHVIGFVNSDNEGAYGLESGYNEELSGKAGRVVTAKNAAGTEMLSRYENYYDSVDGENLHLTLDATIQAMLEATLAEGIETYEVRYGGFAIAMDPNTGAILGMASSTGYDLNDPRAIADPTVAEELEQLKLTGSTEEYQEALYKAQLAQWRSKALNDTYEPGSTFKTLVLAAALEEGVVSPSDTFTCTGSISVNGQTIHCHLHSGHGTQTLAEAVGNSCNPAFIMIGQRLGAEKFYDYLERYNLIGKTGIDIPGETSNDDGVRVWTRDFFTSPTGLLSLATASFGQRLQITPLQLVTAISTAVNGGHLMQPYVVEYTSDNDGNVIYQHQATEVRQVVSESTSQTVRDILEGVVAGGTGKNAYMAGYRIGGKTGTSETSENYRNIVSFIGFAPANDPQVVLLLAYDGPTPVTPGSNYTAGGYYISGGNMASPQAGQLIADILDYLGVQKQYTPEELSGADTVVPNLVGHYLDYAESLLTQNGLSCRTVGTGTVVRGQIPAAGATIPGNSQVVLYLDGETVPTDRTIVPDLSGLTLEEVQSELADADLYLRASGAVTYYSSFSKADHQSIAAGTSVERGTVIEVHFVDTSVLDYTGPVM